MLREPDECDQLLVTNPFADDNSTEFSCSNHDIFVALTRNSSSNHYPLGSQSCSPLRRCHTQSIPSATLICEGETRHELTPLPGSVDRLSTEGVAKEDQTTSSVSGVLRGGSDCIIHPVGLNDSFASVALRYGVSIAALRRANKLWPSDPIHLRTVLLIPRGNILYAGHKPAHSQRADTNLESSVEPPSDLSSGFIASSFVAARKMILSVLPARISLDSLSSRASTSEDHELDVLQKARTHKTSTVDAPFAEDGHELSVLAVPHIRYKLSGVDPSPQVPYLPPDSQFIDLNHPSPTGDLRFQSVSSSPAVTRRWQSRGQPFTVLSVRTSQLEPEPAMELPVRRPRI